MYCNLLQTGSSAPTLTRTAFRAAGLDLGRALLPRRPARWPARRARVLLAAQRGDSGRRPGAPGGGDIIYIYTIRARTHARDWGKRPDWVNIFILTRVQAMPLIRAINSLCVVRGSRPEHQLRFPPDSTSVTLPPRPTYLPTYLPSSLPPSLPVSVSLSLFSSLCLCLSISPCLRLSVSMSLSLCQSTPLFPLSISLSLSLSLSLQMWLRTCLWLGSRPRSHSDTGP